MLSTIVLLEDQLTISERLESCLIEAGFSVVTLPSGCAVVAYLERHTPHIILIDADCVQLDTTMFVAMLVENEATNDIPLVMFGTDVQHLDKHRLWHGLVLAKPCPLTTLVASLYMSLCSR